MTPAPAVNVSADITTQELTAIWQDLLGVENIEADQNYFDLGGESSLAVQMFTRIEKVFKVRLPLATIYEAPTIEELSGILRAEVSPPEWSPLVAIQPSGSRQPFFCFHGAGGNVLSYQKLSQYLGSDQPFYGLQSIGLDGKSAPSTTIEAMAELYVQSIRSVQAHGPYLLGGYCMGGTIAYEVAQRFQHAGEPVAVLALLDTLNWHKVPLTIWNRTSYACERVGFHLSSFLTLEAPDRAKFIRDKVEALRFRLPVWRGMLSAMLHNRPFRMPISNATILGRIWKTNDYACWNYIPKPYPGVILDFRPSKQYRVFDKPHLKWGALATGGQKVVVLPVYPAGMLVEPFVKELAAALRTSIDDVLKNQETPVRASRQGDTSDTR